MALSLLCGIAGASGLGSKQAWYRPNQTAFYSKVASLERGDLDEGRSRSAGGGRLKGAYACAIPTFCVIPPPDELANNLGSPGLLWSRCPPGTTGWLQVPDGPARPGELGLFSAQRGFCLI